MSQSAAKNENESQAYDADTEILQLQYMVQERQLDEMKMKYKQETQDLENTIIGRDNIINNLKQQLKKSDEQVIEGKKQIKKQQNDITRLEEIIKENQEVYEQQKELLRAEIEKIKQNNQAFLEVVGKQQNEMSSSYINKIKIQSEDYTTLLQEQKKKNKQQSEMIEVIQKEKLLLEDQMKKQTVYFKDWNNQLNKAKQQNFVLEQRIKELENQISHEKNIRKLMSSEYNSDEKQIEELVSMSERTNLEIELKNTLEQQQSQYTTEKYKLTEQIETLQRKLDDTKFSLLKDKELLEDQIIKLKQENQRLTIIYQKTKQNLDEIEFTHQNEKEIEKKEWVKQLNQMQKQHKQEILKRKLIAYMQSEVLARKYQQQLQEQYKKVKQDRSNLFSLYDQKKQVSVEEIVKSLDKMNDEQLEIVREKFKKDLWIYVKNKSVERESKFENQIQQLKTHQQKQKNEIEKQKVINHQSQFTIKSLNSEITSLKKQIDDKIQYYEKEIADLIQKKAEDISQLKTWLSDTTATKDKEIQTLTYINQKQSHQLQLLEKKNKEVTIFLTILLASR